MADRYGWTLAEIDRVDRARVRRMWAVRALYADAERYLEGWRKSQQRTQNSLRFIAAASPPPPAETD